MTRIKKTRTEGRKPSPRKPGASSAPKAKASARSSWNQVEARALKRDKKRKGLKPGARQGVAESSAAGQEAKSRRDPRHGSKKAVPLTAAAIAAAEAAAKPLPDRQPVIKRAQTAPAQSAMSEPQMRVELERIENDDRLNALLDRVDDGQKLPGKDQAWLDQQLARHAQLMQALGLDEDDDDLLAQWEE